jgi:peptidoglycan/xylan/chitin deacetylase (PgdA/CDA1 family)
MLISRQTFEQHLDALARHYQFISLDELAQMMEAGRAAARPLLAVTFDDGYEDVYYNAFPILKRKGIPAAVFVVTSLVGTEQLLLHDKLYFSLMNLFERSQRAQGELERLLNRIGTPPSKALELAEQSDSAYEAVRALLVALPQSHLLRLLALLGSTFGPVDSELSDARHMTWEMLQEMQRAGIIIGSHTSTHPMLTNEDATRTSKELEESRKCLENKLGVPIRHVAYPDGRYNFHTLDIAAATGYRYGYGTCQHSDRCYPWLTIPRRVIWERSWADFRGNFSPAVMNCQLNGFFDWAAPCRQQHGQPQTEVLHGSGCND